VRSALLLVVVTAGGPTPADVEALAPDDVPGLVAWYNVESVHRRSRDGDTVRRWKDSSGHGHDLVATPEGRPAVFHTRVLDGKPVISIPKANRFDVTEPFELDDHTIVIVFAGKLTRRAFFSSDTDPKQGIVLRDKGSIHFFQNGTAGGFPYNRVTTSGTGFTTTVLGREAGTLHAFINGTDLSSGLAVDTAFRVGRLFQIEHTTFVGSDGESLRIAEMLFYDRYLDEQERQGVTRHLGEKFGLPVSLAASKKESEPSIVDDEAVRVRVSTRTRINVNDETVAIPWDVAGRTARGFHFDVESGKTRLVCTEDGTRVRVTVTLPLLTRVADASLRLLILVNGESYHPVEALSPPFAGPREDKFAMARLQTELSLDAGDFIEIITSQVGTAGNVRIPAAEALLVVERIE
jgi:hypothetical protein